MYQILFIHLWNYRPDYVIFRHKQNEFMKNEPFVFLCLQQDLGPLAGIDVDGKGAPIEATHAFMDS